MEGISTSMITMAIILSQSMYYDLVCMNGFEDWCYKIILM